MSETQINVAIVGLGGIGNRHAECYQNNDHSQVVAVCDMVEEKARTAAEKFDVPAFASIEQMLAAGLRIDAASVTTGGEENGSHHYEPTMELLEAGVPVLGEKPISNKIAEGREMVAKAKEKNLPYAINLNHRFTPAARRARQWLDDGRLGELNMIHMMMWISNPNESSPHFHMRALHSHSIDVMRYFAGDVKKVQAFFKKGTGRNTWSNAQVNMLFDSGVIGHLVGSYDGGGPGHAWGLERCELIGHEGRVLLEDACVELTYQPRKKAESETYRNLGGMTGFGETFQSRIDAWIDDLINQTPPDKVDGKAEDALKAQLIIEAAISSWDRGEVVEVEPVEAGQQTAKAK